MMKKTPLGLGLAGAALLSWIAAGASATVMVEHSLEELIGGADAIVHATVTESRVRMALSQGSMAPETLTTLRVHEWIAGPGGDTVELRELGGVYQGGGLRYDGTPTYAVGEEVVLFLERRADAPHDLRTFGMVQGKFIVRHGLGGVPSTVRRDLDGIAFVRWANGRQVVSHPNDAPAMRLDAFLGYVRQARAELGGTR
jgi:hypothetical protein